MAVIITNLKKFLFVYYVKMICRGLRRQQDSGLL